MTDPYDFLTFPTPDPIVGVLLREAIGEALPDFDDILIGAYEDDIRITGFHKTETIEVEVGRTPVEYDAEGNEIGGDEPIMETRPRPLGEDERDIIEPVVEAHPAAAQEYIDAQQSAETQREEKEAEIEALISKPDPTPADTMRALRLDRELRT